MIVLALMLPGTAFAAPGNLDTSFASGTGVHLFPLEPSANAMASALQSDGRIITVRICQNFQSTCVTRLSADGSSQDMSFNATGERIINDGAQTYPVGVEIDSSNRILVVASCASIACLFRLTANGVLDTTFGNNGRATFGGAAIALMGDGRIVVAFGCFNTIQPGIYGFCVARLTANGATDPTFNGGSVVQIAIASRDSLPKSVALYPDGTVLVSGECNNGTAMTPAPQFCIARLASWGALDTSYASSGIGRYNFESSSYARKVYLLPDQRVMLAGTCYATGAATTPRACAARLTTAGTLDTSFGFGSYAGTGYQLLTGLNALVDDIRMQDDGGLLFAHRQCGAQFCLQRMLPNGQGDPAFGSSGVAQAAFQATGTIVTLRLVPGNRALVSAGCSQPPNTVACVARVELSPLPGERCSLDLDDDGQVKAATDGLMWLRVMLGIRGNAVTQSALGSNAQRNSWPLIQAYLFNQCGIR
jgi:uncharacterized delta-60 repeat protein